MLGGLRVGNKELSKKQIVIICFFSIILLAAAAFLNYRGKLSAKETAASGAAVYGSETPAPPGTVVVRKNPASPGAVVPVAKRIPAPLREKYTKTRPTPTPSPTPKPTPRPTPKPTPLPAPSVGADKTDRIASFYQGSLSYKSKLIWSGDWGKKKFKKKKFGAFGCGLCCLANVYSSFSPYRCSPLDMLDFAKKSSGYSGSGAIEWWNMSATLSRAGFTSVSGKKPKEYEDFQKIAEKSKAMIVLVSNHNKKSMWEDTTGHYVTLFLYDKKTDQVFLADSGSYERNRQWVSLKKIYHSLKEKSEVQYLSVTGYSKRNDTWRNTEFTGKCILPSNWKTT